MYTSPSPRQHVSPFRLVLLSFLPFFFVLLRDLFFWVCRDKKFTVRRRPWIGVARVKIRVVITVVGSVVVQIIFPVHFFPSGGWVFFFGTQRVCQRAAQRMCQGTGQGFGQDLLQRRGQVHRQQPQHHHAGDVTDTGARGGYLLRNCSGRVVMLSCCHFCYVVMLSCGHVVPMNRSGPWCSQFKS